MNKDTIIKILTGKNLEQQEFLEFITDYVKSELNKDVTQEELMAIAALCQQRVFNLGYAAEQAGLKLGLDIMKIIGKDGKFIKAIVTEKSEVEVWQFLKYK